MSVAGACPSVPMSTAALAQSVGRPPQVVRLSSVQSRHPRLKKKKRMTREELVAALVEAVDALDEAASKGLAVDPAELAGLALRMQTQIRRLIDTLRDER